jgi:hypothetical protein
MLQFLARLTQNAKASHRKRPSTRLGVESLEDRLVMNGAGLQSALLAPSAALSTLSSHTSGAILMPKWFHDSEMGLPALDSNPGAKATLYLDFTGNYEKSWFNYDDNHVKTTYKNITTPAFDTDGDPSTFSATEKAQIKEIWQRVAEAYAPFNINVSTDYYGSFDNGKALHVVIGGSASDWLKLGASGVSSIGSFHDDAPNEVFVFSSDILKWSRYPSKFTDNKGNAVVLTAAVANSISHESGHAFGLHHQKTFNADGSVKATYSTGTANWTPIMGDNLASDRVTWADGPIDMIHYSWSGFGLLGGYSFNIPINEDEMAIIAGADNGFGYRPEPHNITIATAAALTVKNPLLSQLGGQGIIEKMNDVNVFSFTTQKGYVNVRVDAAAVGADLEPKVELWSATGLIASADPATASVVFSKYLAAGTYYVKVLSHGDYGDVGQYSVTVTVPSWLRQVGPGIPLWPLPGLQMATVGNLAGSFLGFGVTTAAAPAGVSSAAKVSAVTVALVSAKPSVSTPTGAMVAAAGPAKAALEVWNASLGVNELGVLAGLK